MTKYIFRFITIILTILLVSCGENPMDKKITRENYEQITEESKIEKKKVKAQKQEKESKALSAYLKAVKWNKTKNEEAFSLTEAIIIMSVKNISNKDIDAFEGTIEIFDKLKNNLITFGAKSTKVIKKQSESTLRWEIDSFNSSAREIKNTKTEDLYFLFKPTRILFTDGKILED